MKDYSPVEVFGQNKFPKITQHPYLITLAPYGYYWFRLKQDESVQRHAELPEIKLNGLADIDHKAVRELEDRILPQYLLKCRWFGGKARTIQRLEVTEYIPVPVNGEEAALLIIEITYNEGLPELYQLALSFAADNQEESLRTHCPHSIIAEATIKGKSGVLYDSVYSDEFRHTAVHVHGKEKDPEPWK